MDNLGEAQAQFDQQPARLTCKFQLEETTQEEGVNLVALNHKFLHSIETLETLEVPWQTDNLLFHKSILVDLAKIHGLILALILVILVTPVMSV